jgi:membrane protease YdiL (CAAX protease family)
MQTPIAPTGRPLSLGRLLAHTAIDAVAAAAVVLGFVFLLSVGLGIAQKSGVDLGPADPLLRGLPVLLVPLSLFGTLLAGVLLWLVRRPALPLVSAPWRMRTVLLILVIAALMQAGAVALSAAARHFGSDITGSNIAVVLAAYAEAPVLTLLAAVLIAPLGEELIFRRVLLHRFAQAGRSTLGLVLTSVGFALIHEPLPGSEGLFAWLLKLSTYALLGFGFGQMYLRTGRLDAAVLGHVLVNAFGMGVLLLGADA